MVFNQAVLTAAGTALLTRSYVSGNPLTFTRVATGSGIHADKTPETLKELTGLLSEKQSFVLTSKSVYMTTKTKLTTVITNKDLAQGYYINELALFAQEGNDPTTEVLYSIAVAETDNTDLFPAYNGSTPVEIIQSFVVTVSNAANVQILIGSEAYALAEDFAGHAENTAIHVTGLERLTWNGEGECTTEFLPDGSITETTAAGVKTTVFNQDGSITETYPDGRVLTTVFNSDGTIERTIATTPSEDEGGSTPATEPEEGEQS